MPERVFPIFVFLRTLVRMKKDALCLVLLIGFINLFYELILLICVIDWFY